MRAPALLLLAALVATTVGGAPAAHAERTYSAGEVRDILDIVETHAARRRARDQKKVDDAEAARQLRAAKWVEALRIGASIKGKRARKKREAAQAREADELRREHLRYLLMGGRAGSGGMPRRARGR